MKRKIFKIFLVTSIVNMALILSLMYHERVITAFDVITMPTSEYPCDKLPFNFSMCIF